MGDRWASTNRNGGVETFTDLAGRPTTTRPHVHTIFDERNDTVTLVATSRSGEHLFRSTLRNPSGNEVDSERRRLARKLADHERHHGDDRLL